MPEVSIVPCSMRAALLGILVVLTACGGQATARRADDLSFSLHLQRSDLRGWAETEDLQLWVTRGLFESSWNGVEPEAIVFCVGVVVVVAVVEASVERSIASLHGTEVWFSVDGYPAYRQRLAWGDNQLWLPSACAGEAAVPVRIDARGAWNGVRRWTLDLSAR